MRALYKTFLGLAFMLSFGSLEAQTSSISPYSRFGPGEVQFYGLGQNQQMGGLLTPMVDSLHVNPSNPASYSFLKLTAFEFGAVHGINQFATADISENNSSTYLNHIAVGLPLGDKFGAGFTIYPYTTLGYNLRASEEVDDVGGVNYFYTGSGGINIFTAGVSYMPIKGLSVGVNLNYLFGRQDRSSSIEFDSTGYYNTRELSTLRVSNFFLSYGVQYKADFSNGKYLTLGATLGPEAELGVESDYLSYSYSGTILGNISIKDTLATSNEEVGSIAYPTEGSFGIGYGKNNHWFIGADYQYKNWSNYNKFGIGDTLNNSYRFAVGGYWVPDWSSVGNYWARVQYRAGFYYGATNLELRGQTINDAGMTFGVAIPFLNKSLSSLNFGVQLGQKGTLENDLIRERYARFTIGLSLNDKWFAKRKID